MASRSASRAGPLGGLRRWVLVGAVGCLAVTGCSAGAESGEARADPIAYSEFASVDRADVVDRQPYDGVVVPSTSVVLYARAVGTLTRAVGAGAQLSAGAVAAFIDERAIVVLPGDIPVYRDVLAPPDGSVLAGADVGQVQQFLAGAGYFDGALDGRFTEALGAASARWRLDNGLSDLPGFAAADILFVPGPGPWRVVERSAEVGGMFSGGPLLTVATGAPAVSVTMDTPPPAESTYAVLPLPGDTTPEIALQPAGPIIRGESGAYTLLLGVEALPEGTSLDLGVAVVVERRQVLATDVIAVPVAAVRLDGDGDTVVACREVGSSEVTECRIVLGVTDGDLVEVLEGLAVGDEVAIAP